MRKGTLEYDSLYRPQVRGYLSGPDAESYEDLSMFCNALRMLKHAAERILGYEDPKPGEPDEDAWVAALAEARGHHWALQTSLARLDSALLGGVEGFLEDVHFERLERKEGREAPAPRASRAEEDEGEDDTPLETAAERAAGEKGCSVEPAEVETPRYGPVELPDGSLLYRVGPGGTIVETLIDPDKCIDKSEGTHWLEGPNAPYHKALAEYCGALECLEQAVEKVQALDPDGYTPREALLPRMAPQQATNLCCLDDAWAAAVECCGAVKPLLQNWLICHVDSHLYSTIDGFLDEVLAEEEAHARRVAEEMHGDEDSDQPITVARSEEVSV